MKVVGIVGITGRAGSRVANYIREVSHFRLGKGVGRRSGSLFPLGSLEDVLEESDFLIEFSSPDLVIELVNKLREKPKPVAICTSNLPLEDEKFQKSIQRLSEKSLVVMAPNVTFGACVHQFLVKLLARVLDDQYDVHVRDEHHRFKKDVVSGTAKSLVRSILKEKQKYWDTEYSFGFPRNGERHPHFVEVSSSRSGGIVGKHEVSFTSPEESIRIVHEVFDRGSFALGVSKILEWMDNNADKVGLYNMEDVFDIRKRFFSMNS